MADRMARRDTPAKRYSRGPLVKVTRTLPVIGLAVTLRAQSLYLESMGKRIGLFADVVSLQGQDARKGAACATPLTVLVVTEDGDLSVFHFASGEIVAEGSIPSRLPIDNQSRGNFIELAVEFLSEVCLRLIPTTEARIAIFDTGALTIFTDESIYSIVSDRFTTTHILFIVCNKIILVVGINELQHVIQSIVLINQLIDLLDSVSSEHLTVGSGQGHGHLLCLVDVCSMAGIGGEVNPQWTVLQLSHAVEHVVDRIDVVCLSGKGATVDRARVVCLRGRGVARFLALSVDLSDVGVVGLFHAAILQGQTVSCEGVGATLGTVTAAATHDPITTVTMANNMIANDF